MATCESLFEIFPHYYMQLVPNKVRTSQTSMQVYTNRIPKMTFAYIYNIKAV